MKCLSLTVYQLCITQELTARVLLPTSPPPPPIKNNIRTVLDHHIEKMIYVHATAQSWIIIKWFFCPVKKTCTTGWLNDKKNTPRDICSHSDTCNNAQHVYIDPLLPLILTFNRTSPNSTFTYLRCYCQVTKRIPNKNICPCKR